MRLFKKRFTKPATAGADWVNAMEAYAPDPQNDEDLAVSLKKLHQQREFDAVINATLLRALRKTIRDAIKGETQELRNAAAAKAEALLSVADALKVLPSGKKMLASVQIK
jgi:uncharacterized protein (DUF885 family)